MGVGPAENPDSCGTAWALTDFSILVHCTENDSCFLVGNVDGRDLGQVDVAVFQDKNMVIPKLPHHGHHVTTTAHPSCLSRLLWFSP